MKVFWKVLGIFLLLSAAISLIPPIEPMVLPGALTVGVLGALSLRKGLKKNVMVSSNARVSTEDRLKLVYKDAQGAITERVVLIKKSHEEDGFQYFRAFDLDINEARTFRSDRIIRLTNMETGEIVV